MSTRNIVLRLLAALSVVVLLAACEETTLETSPEAIVRAIPECSDYEPPERASGPWGEAEGVPNQGVQVITVNEGYTVEICAGGGNQRHDGSFSSPGMLDVGSNFNGWSVTGFTPPPTTTQPTTTSTEPTSTTTAGEETTTTGAETTSTFDPAEVTTTAAGGVTTTQAGGVTTTAAVDSTTTAAGGVTTTVDGGGTLEPGQEATTTTVEGGGTGEPGEETSTTGDEVEGGSDDTLPYTGAGDMTMGGLAGMLLAAGIVLLLLTRKRSGAE